MKHIFAFLLLLSTTSAISQPPPGTPVSVIEQVIPDFLLMRVKQIRFNDYRATCLILTDNHDMYVITVKHLFTKKYVRKIDKKYVEFDSLLCKNNSIISVDLWDTNGWAPLKARIHFDESKKTDACILSFSITDNVYLLYYLSSENFIIGQRCYFSGFPLNLKSPASRELGYSVPFIKFAIFSGSQKASKDSPPLLYLDGNNTFGLSGSPVFYYNYYLEKWRVAGIVTGYLKQSSNVFDTATGKYVIKEENSGIVECVAAEAIQELIKSISH